MLMLVRTVSSYLTVFFGFFAAEWVPGFELRLARRCGKREGGRGRMVVFDYWCKRLTGCFC